MDPNKRLAEQERLANSTLLRVKQLLHIHGPLDNESFISLYQKAFDTDYSCPLKKSHGLMECLKKHFSHEVKVSAANGKNCISLISDSGLVSTPASSMSLCEDASEFPSLAEGAKLPQAPKHNRKERKKPKTAQPIPLKAFLEENGNYSRGRKGDGATSAVPKTYEYPIQMAAANAPQPIQYNQFPVENAVVAPPTQQSDVGVAISSNDRSAVYTYDIEGQPSKTLPSVDDVNQRVNQYRTSIAKAGQYVDVNVICKRLCEYYRVGSVRELRCCDRKQGFYKESDIPAIKEFTMTANKVLCVIQAYCTSSTIATLYDLEKFICGLEKKKSFSELKLGPLQKFPLVWYYFRFPHDRQISELTPADIIQFLWNYGRGKKRTDLKEFLEHIAKKRDFKSPYDMGVRVKSIGLAISTTRKVKFGDREKLKEAEMKLMQSIEEDLDDHLKKLRRGLTGGRHQRHVQDENVIAKVAGMHIEDCIYEVFNFANNTRMQLQQIGAFGFLGALQRIIETMMFFRSKPVWTKLFHVIVATCTYRKIGYDDQKILEVLGFKDSLKKLTDDQMIERFGSDGERSVGSEFRRVSKMKINPGKLLKSTVNWLQNSKKPLDVKTLATIEQKVARQLEGISFDSLGAGPFLSFIQKEEIRPHLGKSIMVSTEEENELHELLTVKEDIRLFVEQCGDENSLQKTHVIQSVRKQFKCTKKWTNCQIRSILDDTSPTASLDPGFVTFIHTLDCGVDESCFSSTDASDGSKTGESIGFFTKEQAIACLKSAPLLENLARWSCWEDVFASNFGDLKSFLNNCKEVYAVETPSQELLRISLDSTINDLRDAILVEDPQEAAGHLLSIIKGNDGIENSPVIRIANVVKSSLSEKLVEHTRDFISIERFILECMFHIPIQFCCSIAQKIFLNPLHDLLGDDYGRDPIPARILRACKSTAERSFLHTLGAQLAVKEWKEDFKQFCFVSQEQDKKSAYFKNVVPEKIKESTTNKAIDVHHNIVNGQYHDKEPDKQIVQMEEAMPKEATLVKSAEESEQEPESISEEDNSSDHSTSIEDVVELDEEEEIEVDEAEERMNQCKELIEKIRKEEFGIGEYVDEKSKARQDKNNERLCRALDRLSKELYAKDTHFVLELIQNADDNVYDDVLLEEESEEKPSVAFIVDENRVTILNNEHGFEDNNIKAICDIGKSTKGKHKKGFIGQKGIGFKSIFRVTDCPEVHSNGFHICFDAREDKMGYILPTWQDNYIDYSNYSPENGNLLINWMTQIDLPLKQSMTMSEKARTIFQNVHPSLLLFLNRLQTLIIENKIDGKGIVMKKRLKGENIVELTQNELPSTWFVFTREISIAVREENEANATDISLAFPLDDIMNANLKVQALPPQNVHAFLPLRSYGFKFLIQADFEVPSSREDIDKDSPWNQEVLKNIPSIVVDAFQQFLSTSSDDSMPSSALLRATKFFQFLPLESEIHGVFKPIARKILQHMQQVDCIPVVKNDGMALEVDPLDVSWTKPSLVLLGDSLLRKIVSPTDLKQYLGWSYMSDIMQQNINPALLKTLGVHAESLDILLEIGISHIKIISEQTDKGEQTVKWIGNWLLCVSQHLEREYDSSSSSLQKIRKSTVFPISNGKIVNLIGEAVFFPFTKNAENNLRRSADDYIVKLEEDLNVIDVRIFNDLDQIGELKLERFLADLGVKKMSPTDVIESHIIPCLKSGKWTEKDHLVVPYLMYIKDQYCQDGNSVDIEALKQCVIISTNHGHVKLNEKQIYFTPKYGQEILDLKSTFPSVKWCLLSSEYLNGSSEVKDWQKFFRKLGVIDFPKMRKNRLTFDRSEMINSPWAGLIGNWRKTGDGEYYINDLSCPEFEEVLDSEDHDQLCRLALQLDSKWKSNFHHLNRVTVEDFQGNEVATTLSSFLIKLQTTAWLPGEVAQQQHCLCKPNDLYLKTTDVCSVLDVFGHYSVPNLKDETFIDAIKLKTCITMETIFERLNEWSHDETFCTSTNHMINVYSFIKERMGQVDPAELNIPLIFVPSKKSTFPNKYYGKFYERGEVCIQDPSGVIVKCGKLLKNKRTLLDKFYPKDILNFFKMDLKIDATPTIRDYMSIACALADDTKLPDAEACRDLMEVFSVIGRKCVPSQNEEDFLELAKYCDDQWSGYQQVAEGIDSMKANFVFENVKEEKIFPTNRNKFVSIKEKPLLPDDRNLQKIFEKEEKVHFIIIPDMRVNFDGKPRNHNEREDRVTRTKRKLKEYEILAFFAACRIDVVSNVVCEPRVVPENVVGGCEKWHRNLSILLRYAQRYMLTNLPDIYEVKVEEDLPKRLRNLTFLTARSIDAVHELKDMDVHVTIKETCFVEHTDKNIYFYILHDSLDETEDILAKFVEIFGIQQERNAAELCDLLALILHDLKDLHRVEKIMEKKRIPSLPESEEIWRLKELVKKETPVQKAPMQVPQQPLPHDSNEMRCWPPTAQESLGIFPPHNRASEGNNLPSEWAEPAPPESATNVALESSNTAAPKVQAPVQNSAPAVTYKRENSVQSSTQLYKKEPEKVNTQHIDVTALKGETHKTETDTRERQGECQESLSSNKLQAANETTGDSQMQIQQPVDAHASAPPHATASPPNDGTVNPSPKMATDINVVQGGNVRPVEIQTQNLHYALETVPQERIADHVTSLVVNPNNADTAVTGRSGEKLVYEELMKNLANEVNLGNIAVKWLNEDKETGLPYDIVIMRKNDDGFVPVKYIEVKATKEVENKAFEMSSNELRSAFHFGPSYDVYRVSGIGMDEFLKIKHLPGFETYLDKSVAKLFIAL